MGAERTRGHDGIATVWATAWIGACLGVGWLALVVAAAVARQHHLDAAADLAALSGAARHQRGGDACGTAAEIASANGAALVRCRVDGDDVLVDVTTAVEFPFGMHADIGARARAGPT